MSTTFLILGIIAFIIVIFIIYRIQKVKKQHRPFDGQNNLVHYEEFKYRFNEPHRAAKDGWILGVVGPYFDDSKPYDNAQCAFRRVSSTVAKALAEEEAKWVHENLSMRR